MAKQYIVEHKKVGEKYTASGTQIVDETNLHEVVNELLVCDDLEYVSVKEDKFNAIWGKSV